MTRVPLCAVILLCAAALLATVALQAEALRSYLHSTFPGVPALRPASGAWRERPGRSLQRDRAAAKAVNPYKRARETSRQKSLPWPLGREAGTGDGSTSGHAQPVWLSEIDEHQTVQQAGEGDDGRDGDVPVPDSLLVTKLPTTAGEDGESLEGTADSRGASGSQASDVSSDAAVDRAERDGRVEVRTMGVAQLVLSDADAGDGDSRLELQRRKALLKDREGRENFGLGSEQYDGSVAEASDADDTDRADGSGAAHEPELAPVPAASPLLSPSRGSGGLSGAPDSAVPNSKLAAGDPKAAPGGRDAAESARDDEEAGSDNESAAAPSGAGASGAGGGGAAEARANDGGAHGTGGANRRRSGDRGPAHSNARVGSDGDVGSTGDSVGSSKNGVVGSMEAAVASKDEGATGAGSGDLKASDGDVAAEAAQGGAADSGPSAEAQESVASPTTDAPGDAATDGVRDGSARAGADSSGPSTPTAAAEKPADHRVEGASGSSGSGRSSGGSEGGGGGGSEQQSGPGELRAHVHPMSLKYAPWRPEWNNSVAICVIMKDENVTDVREWLEYHRWLGVDKVFLYEHTPSEHALGGVVGDLVDDGFLKLTQIDTRRAQISTYIDCLKKYRKQFNWIAYIDADEYIVLRERNQTLKGLLNEFKLFPGLSVYWVNFGWSGRRHRPREGGVLRHYTQCNPAPYPKVKTIVNTFYAEERNTVHNFFYRGLANPVDENRWPLSYGCRRMRGPPEYRDWEGGRIPFQEDGCRLTISFGTPNPHKSVERIALFHFFSKSMEDYDLKVGKGLAVGHVPRSMKDFAEMADEGQTDAPICHELEQVADLCCARPDSRRH